MNISAQKLNYVGFKNNINKKISNPVSFKGNGFATEDKEDICRARARAAGWTTAFSVVPLLDVAPLLYYALRNPAKSVSDSSENRDYLLHKERAIKDQQVKASLMTMLCGVASGFLTAAAIALVVTKKSRDLTRFINPSLTLGETLAAAAGSVVGPVAYWLYQRNNKKIDE